MYLSVYDNAPNEEDIQKDDVIRFPESFGGLSSLEEFNEAQWSFLERKKPRRS